MFVYTYLHITLATYHNHLNVWAPSGLPRVVLLDREPLALQCSLLSAMACGVRAVGDPTEHGPLLLPAEGDGGIAQLLAANGEFAAGNYGALDRVFRLRVVQPMRMLFALPAPALPCSLYGSL